MKIIFIVNNSKNAIFVIFIDTVYFETFIETFFVQKYENIYLFCSLENLIKIFRSSIILNTNQ